MLDFFRDRLSAEEILDYLHHLPRTSAYRAAVADDEELAEQLIKEKAPDESGTPPLTEFSPEVQALAEVRDLLANLLAVMVKANGGKPKKVKPYARPVLAAQRVRERIRYAKHRALTARVLPRKGPDT